MVTPKAHDGFQRALQAFQAGALEKARHEFKKCLRRQPNHLGALNLLGVVLLKLEQYTEAELYLRRASGIAASDVTLYNLGVALKALGRPEEALRCLTQASEINANVAETWNNRGAVLNDLNRFDEAIQSFDRAIAINGRYDEAFYNRGNALQRLARETEALAAYEAAIALNPRFARAWYGRGLIQSGQRNFEAAVRDFNNAVALKNNYAEALFGKGRALIELQKYDEALAAFDAILSFDTRLDHVWFWRAMMLDRLKRHGESAKSLAKVLEITPDYSFARGHLLHQQMLCCDWSQYGPLTSAIETDVAVGKKVVEPFGYQAITLSLANLKRSAEIYAAEIYPPPNVRLWSGERYTNPRIRLGYLSGEFRHHATSILMAGVFEAHDKSRFELFAYDNGWDDGSDLRRRMNSAFDHVVRIDALNDADAATRIRSDNIDILINMNGFFGLGRTGVFRFRPAPVQVNYLGFPGTIGVDTIDYLIGDRFVTPFDHAPFYTERIVQLPDSYQSNDEQRVISCRVTSRLEHGLPEHGFVFCCFNNSYKIVPEVFDVWMRLLRKVEGSVLWLFEGNPEAVANLRREAACRGVAGERLVFASHVPLPDHLARHRLADLFLDTLPYNAHTTASDALWAGLPLLTCLGSTFPGRVGASLLHAAGLSQLVTRSLDEYEALAQRLAEDAGMLAQIRRDLERNRDTCPLFDTKRTTRHLETAYLQMWNMVQQGHEAHGFAVPVQHS